jgi:hypothetical protein
MLKTREWYRIVRSVMALLVLLSMVMQSSATQAEERAGASLSLTVQGDTLSVQSRQMPLGKVLTELARQTHLTIHLPAVQAAEIVSISFHRLPLLEGIRRLLRDKDYVLLSTATPISTANDAVQVTEIRVLPPVSNASKRLTVPQDPALTPAGEPQRTDAIRSLAALQQEVIEAPDPARRVRALQELSAQENSEATLPSLLTALQDEHPQVREIALTLLEPMDGAKTHDAMARVALTDTSAQLRLMALGFLAAADKNAARQTLQQALSDPDAAVRALAEQLLTGMVETSKE